LKGIQSVGITAPTASDGFKFGDEVTLTWQNIDLGSNDQFRISYSVDEGPFAFIASPFHSQLTNNGDNSSYSWIAPDFGTALENSVRIKVENITQLLSDTSEVFRIYFEPDLDIISPIASAEYKFGETILFSWKNQDLGANDRFFIAYRVDGGVFTFIANPFHSQLANSGDTSNYAWVLPDLGTILESQIDIRIQNTTRSVEDTSQAFSAYLEPDLEILNPVSTDQYKFGESILFSWKNQDLGANDRFFIAYRVDGGVFTFIANPFHSQLTNSGDTSNYSWVLPDLGTILESQIDIRIQNTTRSVEDTSQAFRAYFEPLVALEIPDSTDQFKFGEQVVISWLNNDLGVNDRFTISYNVDGGNYTFIANPFHSQLTNDGERSSYNWVIPDLGTSLDNDVSIRVLNTSRLVDDTTSVFKISFDPQVQISAPNEGQYVLQGATEQITWENGDLGVNDRFTLSYSVDSGAFTFMANLFHSQFTNVGSQSVYTWKVPSIESPNVKVIVNNTTRLKSDTSAAFNVCLSCPALNVSSPNGGEQLRAGNSYSIKWSTGETWIATDSVVADYSLDGGSNYELPTIFQGNYGAITANSTSWEVPQNVSSTVKVRVRNITQSISDESAANFSILPAPIPSLTLIKPNGGEVLTGSQQYNIQWTSQNISGTDSLYIELSINNGSSYSIIEKVLFSTYPSRYTWAVPESPSKEAVIRIRNVTNPIEDFSDNSFTILAPNPTISLIQPNGGDSLTVGKTFNITWSTQFLNGSDDLTIALSTDGGDTYLDIATGSVERFNSRYIWNVPSITTNLGRIRLTNTSSGVVVFSESNFFIALPPDPVVNLTSPNGGEVLEAGDNYNILWTLENTTSTDILSIALSNDGGDTYTVVIEGFASVFNGSYQWSVPFTRGSNNKIKITNSTSSVSDESETIFTIEATPLITVVSPNGGEVLEVGSELEISWTTENIPAGETLIIELTSNGGGNYSEIDRGTFGNSYTWVVPDISSTSSMIRVSKEDRTASDISNNVFAIQSVAYVNVTKPNGGEFWEIGTQQNITWDATSFGASDVIQILLSTNGGESYSEISQGPFSIYNGSLFYEVIEAATKNSLIKVINTTKSVEDVSDAPFEIGTIDRTLTLLSPNGGEIWSVGQQEIVSWSRTNMENAEMLLISISYDNGATFSTVGNNSFGGFSIDQITYTVPDIVSDQAIIRLKNTTRSITTQSESVFRIINEIPPVWLSASGRIIGSDIELNFSLNETSTIYLVGLNGESTEPTVEEIKQAGEGTTSIENQVFFGTVDYQNPSTITMENYIGPFVRENLYDVYLVAEDADGNISSVQPIVNLLAEFTLIELDSITLNQLYDDLNGESWINTTADWKTLTLAERTEVNVTGDRVVALDLSEKGITGALSPSVLLLNALTTLNLSENGFSELVSLNSLTSLTDLNVSSNALDFSDLLLVSSFLNNTTDYAPQASIPTVKSDSIPVSSPFLLQVFTAATGNSYDWILSNILIKNTTIATTTANSFLLESLNFDNMGTYKVEITNSTLPGLILEGDEIVIAATANLTGTIQGINEQPLLGGNVRLYQIIEVDTGYFNARKVPVSNGIFTANNLVIGKYLAITDSEQRDADNKIIYLPTYYRGTDLWAEADTILLFSDQDVNDYKMQFFPPPLSPDDGEGVVSGAVESDFDGGRLLERRKVKKAGCSVRRFRASGRELQDGTWEIMAYVETNDNGEFEFNFLPPGTYRFNIEFPGIPMDPDSFVEFEIGGNGFDANNFKLEAFITANGIEVTRVDLLSIYDQGFKSLSIYPNPAKDYLTIAYDRLLSSDYIVEIHNLQGKLIHQEKLTDGFEQEVEIPVSHLEDGIYLATFKKLGNKNATLSMKIVVRH